MNYKLLTFYYIIFKIVHIVNSFDFCDLCDGRHTLCERPQCHLTGQCKNIKQQKLLQEEKYIIVDTHNQYRNKIALGLHPYFPSASNMRKIQWNNELEDIAQCWANACLMKHDLCRDTSEYYASQSIFSMQPLRYEETLDLHILKCFIDGWFKEYKLFNRSVLHNFQVQSGTDHFTQIIWANSYRIGCAKILIPLETDDKLEMRLFCNYGPGGNIIGSSIYNKGDSCSSCPNKTICDDEYTGLCN